MSSASPHDTAVLLNLQLRGLVCSHCLGMKAEAGEAGSDVRSVHEATISTPKPLICHFMP